jgi:hypothetical protein
VQIAAQGSEMCNRIDEQNTAVDRKKGKNLEKKIAFDQKKLVKSTTNRCHIIISLCN